VQVSVQIVHAAYTFVLLRPNRRIYLAALRPIAAQARTWFGTAVDQERSRARRV
jgi:hypothetical protein